MKDSTQFLRPARLSDAEDLHRNCFSEQSLEEVQDYLRWCLTQMEKGWVVRLVAEVDGRAVANGQLTIRRHNGEIGSLVVGAAYRRQGIGKALLETLIQEAYNKGVHTLEISACPDLPWVQAWYQRRGFTFHKEQAFPDGERVVVLRMSL